MNLTLPIYIESQKPDGRPPVYLGRPLFFDKPEVRNEKVDRLLAKLAQDLGQELTRLGRLSRHDALADWTFNPSLAQHRLDLTIQLRRRTSRARFLFVVFRKFDRRLAFTPSVPEVWFDVARAENLGERATEVLTKHFRACEHEDPEFDPKDVALTGTAYVTPLEITIHPPGVPPTPPVQRFLFLGASTSPDGAAELRRVGRCLNWLYPDDLDRALLRDAELAELTRLLTAADQRPVLLVGPRQVGKTALVHEHVYREVSVRASPFRDRENVWLLAPARLISGMSFVGEWENRLLAILKEAKRRRHLLYFDDLLGLFQAGKTSQSSLSVAGVLKPYLERREVRVLGEITPEALRVLREQDRSFADLFHLLPVPEPAEADTLRVLIGVQRQLEGQQRCRFDLDVLPSVLDLQRRYGRDAAFPGKAATFLRHLAVKYKGKMVMRRAALDEFHARSGLSLTFLDRRAPLSRKDVLDALAKEVIGQEAALHAAADVIAIAKARLNDPDRPLAAFLFLGPTGVGKTQCAKALAAYLYGNAERLVRFDLNEYGDPGSAARLVGTFDQPEGLLTGALRRQPFAVVLFDEVEKAHPEVFDLLLQVLGEARLTDALGRTADFSNALIVLTSNLGVRESEGPLGLWQDEADRDARFVQAAERFFRPEFVNRLDRIIPFRRLSREHVSRIAHKLIDDVFDREGLVQRKCILDVETMARERIVDQGYDPVLGARALKRSIERHLTQPLAAQLAALPPGDFTAVRVYAGPERLAVQVQALEQVAPVPSPAVNLNDRAEVLRRVRAAMRRIESELAPLRPTGPITAGQVRPEHDLYFAVREEIDGRPGQAGIRETCRRLEENLAEARWGRHKPPTYRKPDAMRGGTYKIIRNWNDRIGRPILREMAAALDINEYLDDLTESASPVDWQSEGPDLPQLLPRTALLHLLASCVRTPAATRVVLWPHGLATEGQDSAWLMWLRYRGHLPDLHLQFESWPASGDEECLPAIGQFLVVQGPHALPLVQLEAGTHLDCSSRGPANLVRVEVFPLAEGADALAAVRERLAERQQWLDALRLGRAEVGGDPLRLGPVVCINGPKGYVDLRSGRIGVNVYHRWLAALPLPPEITEESPSG